MEKVKQLHKLIEMDNDGRIVIHWFIKQCMFQQPIYIKDISLEPIFLNLVIFAQHL